MTDLPPGRAPFGSASWILAAFIVIGVILASLSTFAAFAVVVVALGFLAAVWIRHLSRSADATGSLSTNCNECGGLLGYTIGLPSRICPRCGHHPSGGSLNA